MTRAFKWSIVLLALLATVTTTLAAETVAELVSVEGRVDILRDGKLPSEKAAVGAVLNVGDFIRTKSNSRAEVLFSDGNRIMIEPRSRVDISNYAINQDQRTLNLSRGKIEAVVLPKGDVDTRERPKRFEIHTPNAVAGIRGTTLVVSFQDSTTAILVKELHGTRSVYSISKFHPDKIIDIPAGGIMWVRDRDLPTPIPPSGNLEFGLLTDALANFSDLEDLQVLVDSVADNLENYDVVVITDAFPELFGVEVGVVSMTGLDSNTIHALTVDMTAHFLALSPDAAPVSWNADNVALSWFPDTAGGVFDATGRSVFISGTGPNGQADVTFDMTSWNAGTGTWTAGVNGGFGSMPNGTSIDFSGAASGTGATSVASGSATGTASGTATQIP